MSLFGGVIGSVVGSTLKDIINDAPLATFMRDTANEAIDNIVGNNKQGTSLECQEAARNSDVEDAMDRIAYGVA
ncbi:MAG: hypothetical protein B6D72_10850 [gamma proteobacterium symbiont of Ctena orbiculata]|uniref:Uncharacterized protein n=1 Tax=Candidatus Thiodiazotropha taylori TaxID=2792791 RepID=A0A944MAB4_9GAMM|nr:hypothetical protein [Candidatus Thiodiazotropha taylori]PVV11250.1 MAG: hypothetical protein B6D72_10850 [gamma proteobacterium symbiont of Ctena orbiculata]MBT2990866.1 hypothetical protein [Candidatus Thiodiazotropha taylori]MBT2996572.1 hypothetical protein [Candidatus Thiodiazotropha taylori]MBT3000612.1 hypothetical protein [Candidatus Thiodiazotropha taylori]